VTRPSKIGWVCLTCHISQVASVAKFPRCPQCAVRMVAAAHINDAERIAKQHPAADWDDASRTLANEIHTVGRECFWV
jgi:hypothetical protein